MKKNKLFSYKAVVLSLTLSICLMTVSNNAVSYNQKNAGLAINSNNTAVGIHHTNKIVAAELLAVAARYFLDALGVWNSVAIYNYKNIEQEKQTKLDKLN